MESKIILSYLQPLFMVIYYQPLYLALFLLRLLSEALECIHSFDRSVAPAFGRLYISIQIVRKISPCKWQAYSREFPPASWAICLAAHLFSCVTMLRSRETMMLWECGFVFLGRGHSYSWQNKVWWFVLNSELLFEAQWSNCCFIVVIGIIQRRKLKWHLNVWGKKRAQHSGKVLISVTGFCTCWAVKPVR